MNSVLLVVSCLLTAQPLTESAAVQQALGSNPTVQAAVTDLRQSAQTVRAEQARYRPTLVLDGTGTTQDTPSLSPTGGTTKQSTQALVFGAELSQVFEWGTAVSVRVENRDSWSSGPLLGGTGATVDLGPGYGVSARLAVTQPLLRGFGTEVGQAALRTELLNRQDAERARDSAASEALSGVLQAYWEAWYARRALAIELDARSLAQQQRDETQRKVKAGQAAEVDLLAYESRLAELEQGVLAAQVSVDQRAVQLRHALGQSQGLSFELADAPPAEPAALDESATLAAAQEASYALARQRLAVERAETALRTAGEATRPRLDAQAWAQTQGLGNQSLSAAFEQVGKSSNVSGNVGLVFELPLSERHQAQVEAARLAVRAARERLDATTQQVLADTRVEWALLSQATRNIGLAERSAEVSGRSAEAQQKRLQAGSATPVEVREAEDALRRARLSVERERVNAAQAQVRLEHLTGALLARWGGLGFEASP